MRDLLREAHRVEALPIVGSENRSMPIETALTALDGVSRVNSVPEQRCMYIHRDNPSEFRVFHNLLARFRVRYP